LAKSKQLQPAGQACPAPQSMGLGMQSISTVVVQTGGDGGEQTKPPSPAEQDPLDPEHSVVSLSVRH
jgi:hypothetical protein